MPMPRLKLFQVNLILYMLKNKPYITLLITAILFFILGLFQSESTIDMNIKDTYYVIKIKDFYLFESCFFLILFMLYLTFDLLKIKLVKWLSKLHIYSTLLIIVLIKINFLFANFGLPERYYVNYSIPLKNDLNITTFGLIFMLFQLLFLINMGVSIIRKMHK